MLSPRYNPFRTERTLEPTLPNPPGAPLCLSSFGSFFGLFAPFLPGNITVLNTPFTCSAASRSFTLMPTTPNHRIRRAIARLNRRERREE